MTSLLTDVCTVCFTKTLRKDGEARTCSQEEVEVELDLGEWMGPKERKQGRCYRRKIRNYQSHSHL